MRVATAVVSNCFNQRNLTALRVVAVQSVVMHHEVHVGLAGTMDDKISARIAVASDAINSLQILERKNVGDVVGIKPHITVALDAGFLAGLNSSAIRLQSHGLLDVPDLLDQGFVAPCVDGGLIVQESAVAQVSAVGNRSFSGAKKHLQAPPGTKNKLYLRGFYPCNSFCHNFASRGSFSIKIGSAES